MASSIYLADYDDTFALPRYNPTAMDAVHDRTWVQLVLPYVRDFNVFVCPSDWTREPGQRAVFDDDIVPGDIYARYYRASMRTNIGYNFVYLSPVIRLSNSSWAVMPRTSSSVADPSNTLMFGDSAWSIRQGRPSGGGHYLVLAPCRYQNVNGVAQDTIGHSDIPSIDFFKHDLQWVQTGTKIVESGGLWPWHSDKITITMVGGNLKLMTIKQVMSGCAFRPEWNGLITNLDEYVWDLR